MVKEIKKLSIRIRITTCSIEQKTATILSEGPDFVILHSKGTTNINTQRRSVKNIPIIRG
jgi:hypothetical protein